MLDLAVHIGLSVCRLLLVSSGFLVSRQHNLGRGTEGIWGLGWRAQGRAQQLVLWEAGECGRCQRVCSDVAAGRIY